MGIQSSGEEVVSVNATTLRASSIARPQDIVVAAAITHKPPLRSGGAFQCMDGLRESDN
jgi:hypothetical protein